MMPKILPLLAAFSLCRVSRLSCAFTLQTSVSGVQARSSALWLEPNNEAEEMRAKAQALRKEVDAFEQEKKAVELEEQSQVNQVRAAKQAVRDRYSALVPILKPDGSALPERVDFRPRWSDGSSFITVCEASLPLGLILGESEEFANAMVVDEVATGTNGEAAGFKVGDIVHACTACKVEMEMPTWQLMAGGIGVPKTKRFVYQADGRPFEEAMEAIASNRQDPEMRPVLVVVERKE